MLAPPVVKMNINQRKIKESCKKIVISTSEHHHLNKITFVLLNHVFFVLIRGPFYTNLKVRIGVFLNNETDLALTIHFHLPNTE